jgi:ferredoxin-NADP reductase
MKFIEILKSPIRFIKDRFFKEYSTEYDDIPKESGKVIEQDNEKIAIYKDSEGKIHKLSPFCTHLGCVVEWNDGDKQWDCPCHGASYTKDGKVTSGPARKDLEEILDESNDNYNIEILEIEQLTHDVKRFKTTKPENYSYTPGQATEVAIDKDGFRDKFRPFTFTSLNDSNYLEFTIKGYPTDMYPKHTGVTEEIHKLEIGDELIIKEPVGTIEYQGKGVFIAGGAGITPFIAIFRDLEDKGELEENSLIYSNKESIDIIIEEELREKFNSKNLILTLSREKIEGYMHGRVDKEMLSNSVSDFNQYFYICGPSGFENDITKALKELGADGNKIVVEEW